MTDNDPFRDKHGSAETIVIDFEEALRRKATEQDYKADPIYPLQMVSKDDRQNHIKP